MNNLPLYENSGTGFARCPGDAHAGLWYDRFFDRFDENWKVFEGAKLAWIETVAKAEACGDMNHIEAASLRLRDLARQNGGCCFTATCDWHFVTGLGLSHPVENGFLWHPVLGVPYLPGAAVKGLVRSYMEAWDDSSESNTLRENFLNWFGSEAKDPRHQKESLRAGWYVFFDALPWSRPKVKADVMTPHMGKWYECGDSIESTDSQPRAIPADWHDPVPVPFLVVDKPQLQFVVAIRLPRIHPDRARAEEQIETVVNRLKDALGYVGAGAKTAVGYGVFGDFKECVEEDPLAEFKNWFEQQGFARGQNKGNQLEIKERLEKVAKLHIVEAIDYVKEQLKPKYCTNFVRTFIYGNGR